MGKGHENKEYVLANTQNSDLFELATIISEISDKRVEYLNPTKETFIETLTNSGVPIEQASFISTFNEAIEQGEFEVDKSDLEELLGRKPTTMKQYLSQIYSFKQ